MPLNPASAYERSLMSKEELLELLERIEAEIRAQHYGITSLFLLRPLE